MSSAPALVGEVGAPSESVRARDVDDTGWKRHVVSSVLNSGVDDAATACMSVSPNKKEPAQVKKSHHFFF